MAFGKSSSPPPKESEPEEPDESEKIARYRFDELRKLNVPFEDAEDLCIHPDVVDQLKALLGKQCPLAVAVRILR
jgi:hypothetical protein